MITKEELNNQNISQKEDELKTLKDIIAKQNKIYDNKIKVLYSQKENWKKISIDLFKKVQKHNIEIIEYNNDIEKQIFILSNKSLKKKNIEIAFIDKEIKKEIERENLFNKNESFSSNENLLNENLNFPLENCLIKKVKDFYSYNNSTNSDSEKENSKNKKNSKNFPIKNLKSSKNLINLKSLSEDKKIHKNVINDIKEKKKEKNITIQDKIKSIIYPKDNKTPKKIINNNNNNILKTNTKLNNNNFTFNKNNENEKEKENENNYNYLIIQENAVDNSNHYNINAINESPKPKGKNQFNTNFNNNNNNQEIEILKINKTKNYKNLNLQLKNKLEKLSKKIEEESNEDIFINFILPNLEEYLLKKKIYAFEFNKGNLKCNQFISEKIFVSNFDKYENIKLKIFKKENKRINVIGNAIENFFLVYLKKKDLEGNLIIKGILNKSFEKFDDFFRGKKKSLEYCESIKLEVYMFKWDLFFDYDIDEYRSNFDLKELKKLKDIGGILRDTRKCLLQRNLMIEQK
jgi:hypothetical protein